MTQIIQAKCQSHQIFKKTKNKKQHAEIHCRS